MKSTKNLLLSTKSSTHRKRSSGNTIRSRKQRKQTSKQANKQTSKQANKQTKQRKQTKKHNYPNKGGGPLNKLYNSIFKLSDEWLLLPKQMPSEGFRLSNIIAIGTFRYKNHLKIFSPRNKKDSRTDRHKLFCVYKNPNDSLVIYCKSMPWNMLNCLLLPLKYLTKLFNPLMLLFAFLTFYRHLTKNPEMIDASQVVTTGGYYRHEATLVDGFDPASIAAQNSSLLLTSGVASAIQSIVPYLIIGFIANKTIETVGKQTRVEDMWDVWKTKDKIFKKPNNDDDKPKVLEYINIINHQTRHLYTKWYAVTKTPKMEMDLSFGSNAFGKIVYGDYYTTEKYGLCAIDWIKRVDSYTTQNKIKDINNDSIVGTYNKPEKKYTLNGLTTSVENKNDTEQFIKFSERFPRITSLMSKISSTQEQEQNAIVPLN